jgi:hypothetical protein
VLVTMKTAGSESTSARKLTALMVSRIVLLAVVWRFPESVGASNRSFWR